MKIATHYDPKPIPTRAFDWSAVDDDTYDGDERQAVWYGSTEGEAVADLMGQVVD